MRELVPNKVNYYYAPDGKWTYDGGRHAITQFVKQEIQHKRFEHLHGIFACNDEMALGIENTLEAMLKSTMVNVSCCQGVAIVGFDYTKVTQAHWRAKQDGLMIGTVDAQVRTQAETASSIIRELINDPSQPHKIKKIAPERRDRLVED